MHTEAYTLSVFRQFSSVIIQNYKDLQIIFKKFTLMSSCLELWGSEIWSYLGANKLGCHRFMNARKEDMRFLGERQKTYLRQNREWASCLHWFPDPHPDPSGVPRRWAQVGSAHAVGLCHSWECRSLKGLQANPADLAQRASSPCFIVFIILGSKQICSLPRRVTLFLSPKAVWNSWKEFLDKAFLKRQCGIKVISNSVHETCIYT